MKTGARVKGLDVLRIFDERGFLEAVRYEESSLEAHPRELLVFAFEK
jgi:hypothetical protein